VWLVVGWIVDFWSVLYEVEVCSGCYYGFWFWIGCLYVGLGGVKLGC